MINPGGLHRQAVFLAQWKLERMGNLMETSVFELRIINMPDGNQIIDTTLKTPYDALTFPKMAEYIEVDTQLDYMDRMKWKAQREAERQRNLSRNLLYRAACLFGIA